MIQPNNYRIDEAKYKSLLKYIRLSVIRKIWVSTGNRTNRRCYHCHNRKFQCFHRQTQKQKDIQCQCYCRIGSFRKGDSKVQSRTAILQESNPIHRHRTKQVPLPQSASSNPQTGRIAYWPGKWQHPILGSARIHSRPKERYYTMGTPRRAKHRARNHWRHPWFYPMT